MFHTIVTVAFYRYSQTPSLSLMNHASAHSGSFFLRSSRFPFGACCCTSRIKSLEVKREYYQNCFILPTCYLFDGHS